MSNADLTRRGAGDEPDDLAPVKGATALDNVLAVFDAEVAIDTFTIDVPLRPGVKLHVDPNPAADGERYKEWQKRARDKSWRMSRDEVGIDAVKLAGIVLANCTVKITATDPQTGTEVDTGYTFATPAFRERLDANGPAHAVKLLFGSDGHMLKAARQVSEAAGMDDEDLTTGGAESPT